ncbi:unnamed protein product [Rangifer tarandus platyrhynchus]|uniref:Uncharacterized protein n=2 Tax=Rangifer tarandus platyrhynchus TaxID=3082113 RepID=A0ABN8ZYR4_RANTA|nr:unnamed protein product [Rangifer tarandus platyrhynchus]CAI9713691.1 unnamed protein product [Rangifer tarandus platyrhynchus]
MRALVSLLLRLPPLSFPSWLPPIPQVFPERPLQSAGGCRRGGAEVALRARSALGWGGLCHRTRRFLLALPLSAFLARCQFESAGAVHRLGELAFDHVPHWKAREPASEAISKRVAGTKGEESSEWEAEPGAQDPSRQSQVKAPSLSLFFSPAAGLEPGLDRPGGRGGKERARMRLSASPSRCLPEPLSPPSLRTHSPSPGAAHTASLGLRLRPSPSCPGPCLGSRAAAPSAPSPLPQAPCTRAASVHLWAAVVGIIRDQRLPSASVSKPWQRAQSQPWTQKDGCSALFPGLFSGLSPPARPERAPLHALAFSDLPLRSQSC